MAAVLRDIYCNLSTGDFVISNRSSQVIPFTTCFHQDNLRLRVHPLELDPEQTPNLGPFAELDPTGWSLSVKIFNSAGTVLASQTSWSVSGTTLLGTLDLNTSPMATEFPALPGGASITSISAIAEFEFTDGSGFKLTVQDPDFTIRREYNTAGTPSALPLTSYYTAAEIDARFVRFSGNPNGSTVTLPSPNGTHEVEIGCDDDGSYFANAS